MIVVRFKGGLGNQLFQYAAGRALAARHGVALRFDLRWFDSSKNLRPVVRSFDLPYFKVHGTVAEKKELQSFYYQTNRPLLSRAVGRISRSLRGQKLWIDDTIGWQPKFNQLGRNVLIEGYFQDPAYLEPIECELRQELRLRTAPPEPVTFKANELASVSSICIQVRRTDMVTDPRTAVVHGSCSLGYFRTAWAHISERVSKPKGFVFADDPIWASSVFRDWPEISVIDEAWNGPAYTHKFFLMRSCRHFIIANSTWGWWTAWLGAGDESIVVMPKQWYVDDRMNMAARSLRLPGWYAC